MNKEYSRWLSEETAILHILNSGPSENLSCYPTKNNDIKT